MLFTKLFLTTAMAILGLHGPHHCSARHGCHPLGIWHGFTGRTEFVTRGTLDGIDGQNVVPPLLMGLPEAIIRPPAPVVVLYQQRESAPPPPSDPTGEIFSVDRPDFWTPVPYGPVTVEVRLPLPSDQTVAVEYITLLLDGEPVDSTRYFVGPQMPPEMQPDGQLEARYIYRLPCMAPGTHIVQARYKIRSLWSRISEPLHFDVRLPNPPKIIAVSDFGRHPTPLRKTGRVSITKPDVTLQFANIRPDDQIVVYLDGEPLGPATNPSTVDACCRMVRLQGHIVPGIHTLTARTVHSGDGCSITSKPSNEVVFHYYDEDVYLLRPEGKPKPRKRVRGDVHSSPPASIDQPEVVPTGAPAALGRNGSWGRRNANFPVSHAVLQDPVGAADSTQEETTQNSAFTLVVFQQSNQTLATAEQLLDRTRNARSAAAKLARETQQLAERAETVAETARRLAAAAAKERDATIEFQETMSVQLEQIGNYLNAIVNNPFARSGVVAQAQQARFEGAEAFDKLSDAVREAAKEAGIADRNRKNADDSVAATSTSQRTSAQASRTAAERLESAEFLFREIKQRLAGGESAKAGDALAKLETAVHRAEEAQANAQKAKDLAAYHHRTADGHRAAITRALAAATEARQEAAAASTSVSAARQITYQAVVASFDTTSTVMNRSIQNQPPPAQESADRAATSARNAVTHAKRAQSAADEVGEAIAAASDFVDRAINETTTDSWTADECFNAARSTVPSNRDPILSDPKIISVLEVLIEQIESARERAASLATAGKRARDKASEHARLLERTSHEAQSHATAASKFADQARRHANLSAKVQSTAIIARTAAKNAQLQLSNSVKNGDLSAAIVSISKGIAAVTRAAWYDAIAINHRFTAEQIMRLVVEETRWASQAASRAAELKGLAVADAQAALSAAKDALIETKRAERLEGAVEKTVDVQLTAEAMKNEATLEEARADARIVMVEEQTRMRRARNTEAPPSPYYFAAPAHFPIREFGMRGEVLDREGAVIHEDMKFSFDREGNYWLDFTIRTPAVPTTVRLQLLVQPSDGAAWHTITLPPMRFRPEEAGDGTHRGHSTDPAECTVAYNHQCRGRSEILRRFYAQMGADTTIRRKGTARFGFGFEASGRTAAY